MPCYTQGFLLLTFPLPALRPRFVSASSSLLFLFILFFWTMLEKLTSPRIMRKALSGSYNTDQTPGSLESCSTPTLQRYCRYNKSIKAFGSFPSMSGKLRLPSPPRRKEGKEGGENLALNWRLCEKGINLRSSALNRASIKVQPDVGRERERKNAGDEQGKNKGGGWTRGRGKEKGLLGQGQRKGNLRGNKGDRTEEETDSAASGHSLPQQHLLPGYSLGPNGSFRDKFLTHGHLQLYKSTSLGSALGAAAQEGEDSKETDTEGRPHLRSNPGPSHNRPPVFGAFDSGRSCCHCCGREQKDSSSSASTASSTSSSGYSSSALRQSEPSSSVSGGSEEDSAIGQDSPPPVAKIYVSSAQGDRSLYPIGVGGGTNDSFESTHESIFSIESNSTTVWQEESSPPASPLPLLPPRRRSRSRGSESESSFHHLPLPPRPLPIRTTGTGDCGSCGELGYLGGVRRNVWNSGLQQLP